MRIRTQFKMMMLLFGVTLLGIAAAEIVTHWDAVNASQRGQQARQIAQTASELRYLSNDFLIYRENQQLSRWRSRYAALARQVADLNVTDPQQQALAYGVAADARRMKVVFDSLGQAAVSAPSGSSGDLIQLQVSWSRMGVQVQELMNDATRLATLLEEQADRLRALRNWLTYVMIGVFGSYFLIGYLTIQRRILRSIAALQAGVAVIGSGNLDTVLAVERDDEIGELTRAFNGMAANLARANAALVQQAIQLRMLHGIDQAILAVQSPSAIAGTAAAALVEATASVGASVVLIDVRAGRGQLLASHGVEVSATLSNQRLDRYWMLEANLQGHIGMIQDVAALPDDDALKGPVLAAGVRSCTGVPLVFAGKVIGAIVLGHAEPGALPEDIQQFVCQVADQVALALHNARLFEEVQKGQEQLRTLSHHLVALQEEERRNLSRELHDHSGQSMIALQLGLGLLRREADCSPAVLARVEELLQTADTASRELHDLAVGLRPSALDRFGLVPALEQLLASFGKQSAVEVEIAATGLDQGRLPDDVETALYRIAQEALTNVSRYAGASRVGIVIGRNGDEVSLVVEDDGRGFDVEEALSRGRLGLLGVRERAEMLGGWLEIESAPGAGTTVSVVVPAHPTAVSDARAAAAALQVDAGPDGRLAPTEQHLPEAELARTKALGDALVDLTAAIAVCADADQILGLLPAMTAAALDCESAAVSRRDGDAWQACQAYGIPAAVLSQQFSDEEAPASAWVERTRLVLAVDASHDPVGLPEPARTHGVVAYAGVPLLAGDELLGVLFVNRHVDPSPWSPSEIEFLNRLTGVVSLALVNARLQAARPAARRAKGRLRSPKLRPRSGRRPRS